jgi:hypothetical protein
VQSESEPDFCDLDDITAPQFSSGDTLAVQGDPIR